MLREMDAVDLFDKVSAALFCQSRIFPHLPVIPVQHFGAEDMTEFRGWLERHRPDVVLGFNPAVCGWLDKCGFEVPAKMPFASLDSPPTARHRGKVVSGANPDYALIGRTSVEQLDLLLRTHQHGVPSRPLTVHVPSGWVPGETMVPVPEPAAPKRSRRAAPQPVTS